MLFTDIVALIPASGKGERFGLPKSEAKLGGLSFCERIEATLDQAGVVRVSIARDWDTPDMLSTLRVCVKNTPQHDVKGWLVFPVDHPYVKAETVTQLCQAFMQMPDAVIRPTYQGKSGHPVLIPVWLDFSEEDGGLGLAGLIRSQACTVIDLPVDDPGILKNVNHPEDMEN